MDGKEYYYITFRNIFSLTKKIHKKYDLKVSGLCIVLLHDCIVFWRYEEGELRFFFEKTQNILRVQEAS